MEPTVVSRPLPVSLSFFFLATRLAVGFLVNGAIFPASVWICKLHWPINIPPKSTGEHDCGHARICPPMGEHCHWANQRSHFLGWSLPIFSRKSPFLGRHYAHISPYLFTRRHLMAVRRLWAGITTAHTPSPVALHRRISPQFNAKSGHAPHPPHPSSPIWWRFSTGRVYFVGLAPLPIGYAAQRPLPNTTQGKQGHPGITRYHCQAQPHLTQDHPPPSPAPPTSSCLPLSPQSAPHATTHHPPYPTVFP